MKINTLACIEINVHKFICFVGTGDPNNVHVIYHVYIFIYLSTLVCTFVIHIYV